MLKVPDFQPVSFEHRLTNALLRRILTSSKAKTVKKPLTLSLLYADTVTRFNTGMSSQRKCFFANGHLWAFFTSPNYLSYRSSVNGYTWGSLTTLVPRCYGYPMGYFYTVWNEGNNVYFAHATDPDYVCEMWFYLGTLNGDGTITLGDKRVVESASEWHKPSICVDSDGYPWIAYTRTTADFYVIQATATDGSTWGTPERLGGNVWGVIVPLTGGKVYVAYCAMHAQLYGKLFDGESWGSAETISTTPLRNFNFTLVAHGDIVYAVWHCSTTFNLNFNKRNGSWGSEITVESGQTTYASPTLSLDPATGKLYLFWSHFTDGGYMKVYNPSSGWEAGKELVIPYAYRPESNSLTSYYVAGSRIGYEWMKGKNAYHNFQALP